MKHSQSHIVEAVARAIATERYRKMFKGKDEDFIQREVNTYWPNCSAEAIAAIEAFEKVMA